MTLDPVRADTLPENMRYADDGCEESPSCLNCPLPICKYDDPGWLRREDRRHRDDEIFRLRKEGVPVPELARQFRVSTRTVHRVIQRGGAPEAESAADDDEGPLVSIEELASRSIFRMHSPLPQIRPFLQRSA
jgi:hypothetical protein